MADVTSRMEQVELLLRSVVRIRMDRHQDAQRQTRRPRRNQPHGARAEPEDLHVDCAELPGLDASRPAVRPHQEIMLRRDHLATEGQARPAAQYGGLDLKTAAGGI